MGYFIGIQCRGNKGRDTLLAFLQVHFRPAHALFPWMDTLDPDLMPPPRQARELCTYVKGARDIGWWRNAGWDHEERIYAQSFLRWMALRVGARALFDRESIPGVAQTGSDPNHVSLPYVTCDNVKTPVVVLSENPAVPTGCWAEGFEVCDDVGWAPSTLPISGVDPQSPIGRLRRRSADADPLIRAELLRLDTLWGST